MKPCLTRISLMAFVCLTFCQVSAIAKGGIGTGGGDTCEARIQEIRDDILQWISQSGHLNPRNPLRFNPGESAILYAKNMTDKLSTEKRSDGSRNAKVKIECNNKPVDVYDKSKVCRFDREPTEQITCNFDMFLKHLNEDQQYRLIHHEYAELSDFEKPFGSQSQYYLSDQIVARLENQVVRRLAISSADPANCGIPIDPKNESQQPNQTISDIASNLLVDGIKSFTVCSAYGSQTKILFMYKGKYHAILIRGH